MKDIKNIITAKLDLNTIEIAKKSIASIAVKVLGIFAGLGVSIILGQTLGVEGYGVIELANRFVSLVMIVSLFGMQNVILKEVSIGYDTKNWQLIKDVLGTSVLFTGLFAFTIAILLYFLTPFFSTKIFDNKDLIIPLQVGLAAMVFQTISRSFASAVNGFRRVWQSNLVDQTLSMLVVLLGLATFIIFDVKITIINTAILYGISRVVVTVSIGGYWKKLFPYNTEQFKFQSRLFKPARQLWLASAAGLIAVNVNSIFLGTFSSFVEVGLFNASSRIAFAIVVLINVVNTAVAPSFASFFANRNFASLQELYNKVTIGLICLALFIDVFVFFCGKFILGLWGADFISAYPILIILTVGQSVSMGMGGSSILLMMSSKERIVERLALFNLFFGTLLSFVLIFIFGAIGAAIGSAISVIVLNILRCYFVERYVGVIANPFKIVVLFFKNL